MKKYPTGCYICRKKLTRTHFDVVIGAMAFFLCPKHYKETLAWFEKGE